MATNSDNLPSEVRSRLGQIDMEVADGISLNFLWAGDCPAGFSSLSMSWRTKHRCKLKRFSWGIVA